LKIALFDFRAADTQYGGSRFIRARREADSGRARLDANFAVIFAARAPLIRKSRDNVTAGCLCTHSRGIYSITSTAMAKIWFIVGFKPRANDESLRPRGLMQAAR